MPKNSGYAEIAGRFRRETEDGINELMRQGVDPAAEYRRLVADLNPMPVQSLRPAERASRGPRRHSARLAASTAILLLLWLALFLGDAPGSLRVHRHNTPNHGRICDLGARPLPVRPTPGPYMGCGRYCWEPECSNVPPYVATVGVVTSLHGPFSLRVLT